MSYFRSGERSVATGFEISIQELAEAMEARAGDFILLDVREAWELQLARLEHERLIVLPMGMLTAKAHSRLPAPSPDHVDVYVLCHHGLRSAAAVRWLRQQGWLNSYNIRGGIDAYQRLIDPEIGRY